VPVLLAVGLVAAALLFLVRGPLAPADDRSPDCPATEAPEGGADGQIVEGDVTGDGCTEVGVYRSQSLPDGTVAMVLTIPFDGVEQRFAMGDAGDQLVLGDWDCDDIDTVGLYRATAGAVQYFDVWPTVEQSTYRPDTTEAAAVGGIAGLDEGRGAGGDCDRIVVSPPTPDATESGLHPQASDRLAATRTAGLPA
jgi:hypothetical protein